jgi:hypothetical protein
MESIARRFGVGSAVALAVAVATGVAMASHFHLWGSDVLQLKLTLLVVVLVLTEGCTSRARTAPSCPGCTPSRRYSSSGWA